MAGSKEDVASIALIKLGEPKISDFSDGSDAGSTLLAIYEEVILSLLAAHDWSFARTRDDLVLDAATTPVNEWKNAFILPELRAVRVGKPLSLFSSSDTYASPVFGYEVEGRYLFTNYDTAVIKYTARKPESEWPGYFVLLAAEALAAALALPITENQTRTEHHISMAYGSPSQDGMGGMMGTAMAADAYGDPTESLLDDSNPIGDARFGGFR